MTAACLIALPAQALRDPGPAGPSAPLRPGGGPPAPDAFERDAVLGVSLPNAPTSESAVAAAVEAYLAANRAWLGGVHPRDLRSSYVTTAPAEEGRPAIVAVQFVQTRGGIDVADTYVHTSVKLLPGDSVLIAVRARLFPHVNLPAGRVPAMAALRGRGARALGLAAAASPKIEHRRIRYLDGRWRRVAEMRFADNDLTAVVDEDSEATWLQDDRRYADLWFTLQESVGHQVFLSPLYFVPMADLRVTRTNPNGDTFVHFLDRNGFTVWNNVTTNITLSYRHRGRYAILDRKDGVANWHDSVVGHPSDGALGVTYGGIPNLNFNSSAQAEPNGYWFTTNIHHWVSDRNAALAGLIDSYVLPVGVNYQSTCNAFFDPFLFELGFYAEGGGCLNSAYETIIYHEFGHFVDASAGFIQNGGLSEGWGDVLATYSTGQPIIGADFHGPGLYVRTADNNRQYNPGLEVHDLGESWAGFGWHMRANLGAAYGASGVALAEQLMLYALQVNSANIPAALTDVLLRDDNNANLADCTPHAAQIVPAAQQHGIPLPAGYGTGCC